MNAALVADFSFSPVKGPLLAPPAAPALKLVDGGRDFVTQLLATASTPVAVPASDMRVVFDLAPALSVQRRVAIIVASFLVSCALFSIVAMGLTNGAKLNPVTHDVARA